MTTRSSVLKRPVRALDAPLDARTVALRLGVALSTLNMWLAADEERPLAERRFQFHVYHGRKRLWLDAGFQSLKSAIETESQPGGCLGGWRDGSGRREASGGGKNDSAAAVAMRKVLAFRRSGVTSYGSDTQNRVDDNDNARPPALAGDADDAQPAMRKPK